MEVNKPLILEVSTKAFIKGEGDRYLFLRWAKAKLEPGVYKWDIPGGRIIPGETQIDALKREIKEETNLNLTEITGIKDVHDSFYHKGHHTVRICYKVICSGEIKLNEEHSEYKWLSLQELWETIDHNLIELNLLRYLTNFFK